MLERKERKHSSITSAFSSASSVADVAQLCVANAKARRAVDMAVDTHVGRAFGQNVNVGLVSENHLCSSWGKQGSRSSYTRHRIRPGRTPLKSRPGGACSHMDLQLLLRRRGRASLRQFFGAASAL